VEKNRKTKDIAILNSDKFSYPNTNFGIIHVEQTEEFRPKNTEKNILNSIEVVSFNHTNRINKREHKLSKKIEEENRYPIRFMIMTMRVIISKRINRYFC
jgi:hypothetical protein